MIPVIPLILYLSLVIFTILFQFGLILGRPWGEYTMGGGTKDALPAKLRVAPGISIVILSFFIYSVLVYTGFFPASILTGSILKYFITGFHVLAVIANVATRSVKERNLWAPITVLMLLSVLFLLY